MIRNLDIHPAFGFETSKRWDIAVAQRDAYLVKNDGNTRKRAHHFGGTERMYVNNLSKCAGYIPVINIIVGIARIIMNLKTVCSSTLPVKRAIAARHIVRGVAEIFLGPLLVFADLFQTLRDQATVREYNKTHITDEKGTKISLLV